MVVLVVTTMALAPSLMMNQSAEATSHTTKCEAEKGKSSEWIKGCKDGWFNWDQCNNVNPPKGTTQYDEGFKAGYKKGQTNNPNPCDQ